MSAKPATRRAYHHGDLRAALLAAAEELIAERGVRAFSLAEASRRLGVAVAAPYRHFTDREDLLAVLAVRALEALTDVVRRAVDARLPPSERLAAAAAAYVRFAAERQPLFETLFWAGLDKRRHPDLERATASAAEILLASARELCDGDEARARALMHAVATVSHGAAALLIDGNPGRAAERPLAVRQAVAQAATLARAVAAGREHLQPAAFAHPDQG